MAENGTPAASLAVTETDAFAGGGETGALLRSRGWAATPLGPIGQWPQSLKTVIRILLDSRYSMWVGWGSELLFFYNDAYRRDTLGKKHPWALGRPVREVWAEVWPDLAPRIDRVMVTGEATWDEGLLLFLERSGYAEETYHRFSYSPLYDDAGNRGGIFCVVTEETERIIAQRRATLLREAASALGAIKTEADVFAAVETCLSGQAPDLPFTLAYLFDRDGKRPHLVGSTGIEADQAAVLSDGAPWPLKDIVATNAPLVVSDLSSRLAHVPTGCWRKPPQQALLVPIAQQGQVQPAGVFIAGLNPHRPLDEGYRGFINLFVGQVAAALANARAYEQERKRAEALAEIDRAKTTFFSNVSHELRTPLTLILSPVEDSLADPETSPAQRQRLELTHRNSLRLLKLVNSLLDFSRIEAGRVQASYEPTDVCELTAELASVFRSAIERAGMTLDVRCEKIDEPVFVDRDMWEKVVLNLLSNAFKFTLEGEIAVTLKKAGTNIELAVRDTGVGIPQHELANLFQRFYRIEGAAGRTHEGTGIGLALVHELVKLHGGSVRVQSTEGKGSEFTVAVPLGSAHLPADRIRAQRSLPSTMIGATAYLEEALRWLPSENHAKPMEAVPSTGVDELRRSRLAHGARVVLADDNADMREYLERLLTARGFDVEAVGDGQAALAAIKRKRPELVLTDVMMPQLDGFGLLKAIRADPSIAGIAVVMLSARAGEEATVDGLEAGADDYVVKPFSGRELLAKLEGRLALVAARREAIAREAELRADTANVLESMTESFIAADGQWKITYVNAAAERILGVPRASLIGGDFWAAFPKNAGTTFEEQFRRAAAEREANRFEAFSEAIGRLLEVNCFPVRSGGIALYFRDVTERRRLADERERLLEAERAARSEAERAGRMKDEFLATLSHELRTPLNAILGWAQLLRRSDHRTEDFEQGLEAIERNSRAQTQLIEDLLDMSRIISGKIRLDVQRTVLSDVVNAAMEAVAPAAQAKGVRIEKVLDPLAGPVSGDPNRLQQVVWNLLSNAVKFTSRGGRVLVVLERVNSHVEVSVSDTGKGIRPEFLPFVFERFRQEDSSTTRKHGGLGLGLSIVKHLVELHGGAVRAKSPGEGQGATFIIALPLPALRQDSGEPPREHPAGPYRELIDFEPPDLHGVKVLVVDDDKDAREVIGRMLAEGRATILTAASAAEGLEILQRERPHVLVSDIGMPDEDGYEFARKVRKLPPASGGNTPAVALTAFARSDDRRRALLAGFQIHVAKPVEPAELLTVCASLANVMSARPPEIRRKTDAAS